MKKFFGLGNTLLNSKIFFLVPKVYLGVHHGPLSLKSSTLVLCVQFSQKTSTFACVASNVALGHTCGTWLGIHSSSRSLNSLQNSFFFKVRIQSQVHLIARQHIKPLHHFKLICMSYAMIWLHCLYSFSHNTISIIISNWNIYPKKIH